eukprot:s233_g23.t1
MLVLLQGAASRVPLQGRSMVPLRGAAARVYSTSLSDLERACWCRCKVVLEGAAAMVACAICREHVNAAPAALWWGHVGELQGVAAGCCLRVLSGLCALEGGMLVLLHGCKMPVHGAAAGCRCKAPLQCATLCCCWSGVRALELACWCRCRRAVCPLELSCWCRCNVPLQGAVRPAAVTGVFALWGLLTGAVAKCRCKVLLSECGFCFGVLPTMFFYLGPLLV